MEIIHLFGLLINRPPHPPPLTAYLPSLRSQIFCGRNSPTFFRQCLCNNTYVRVRCSVYSFANLKVLRGIERTLCIYIFYCFVSKPLGLLAWLYYQNGEKHHRKDFITTVAHNHIYCPETVDRPRPLGVLLQLHIYTYTMYTSDELTSAVVHIHVYLFLSSPAARMPPVLGVRSWQQL